MVHSKIDAHVLWSVFLIVAFFTNYIQLFVVL